MRKNKKIMWFGAIGVLLLVAATGCKKFLDRKPLTATITDLSGPIDGEALGFYNTLRTYAGFSALPWLDFHVIRGDDAEKGSNQTDGAEINAEFDTYNYAKDDWAPNTYWNDHYYMINLANTALFDADSLKATDPKSVRNIGEAYFFRAYSYFELVKTYGDVPKLDKKIIAPTDAIKPKSSVADIYALIDADLAIAQRNLPVDDKDYGGDSYKGRLTRGAALALSAQSHLFRRNWAQVVSLCNQIIGSGKYSLLPNFVDIWKDGVNGAGKNSAESIFEMNAAVGANAVSNSAAYFGASWGTSQQVRQGGASLEWNLGWGWGTPTEQFVSSWDSTDPRKARTILYSGQSDGGAATGGYGAILPPYNPIEANGGIARKYWNKKMYIGNDPAMRAFTGYRLNSGGADWINHRIIRYADVILMLAEASNELGNGATAEANLELIRNRASGNLGPTRTVLPFIKFVNQDQMRKAIKEERKYEFAMEGSRFYDLVRWGDADSVLQSLGYTHRARFYPIPQKAIDLAPGVLTQNPEWQ
jgi:starch-binding outer membrane protein, SusD/RagB family